MVVIFVVIAASAAGLFGLGYALGISSAYRKIDTRCNCGHDLCFHDEKDRCHFWEYGGRCPCHEFSPRKILRISS